MIFGDVKVWTPDGWMDIRAMKDGDEVWSWGGRRWQRNQVARLRQGQVRSAVSLISMDGVAPNVLRCSEDQRLLVNRWRQAKAHEVAPGLIVTCSEGAHLFRAEVTLSELTEYDEPQAVYGFELNPPRNFLAAGFLLRA